VVNVLLPRWFGNLTYSGLDPEGADKHMSKLESLLLPTSSSEKAQRE